MNRRNLHETEQSSSRGFSTLEVLLVMVVSLIIAAFAIPGFNQVQRTLRISGDARDLNGAINQAKMQAAADFTDARVQLDLAPSRYCPNTITGCTYHVDVWNKTGNGGAGCWQVVGDFNNPCYTPGVSPVQILSPGLTFGFAGVGAPPPNTQANGIGQAPRCAAVNGRRVGQVPTTGCIHFNSRGIPIDNNTGAPTGNDAIYITDNTQVYGVTVGATGLSQVWANNIKGNANWYRK
jgi:type II secretory pathway pseudopilin PulG